PEPAPPGHICLARDGGPGINSSRYESPSSSVLTSHGGTGMKVYLIVAKGKRQGFPIQIPGDLFMLGSEPICQLRSQLPGIAPRHCVLVVKSADERKVFLRDLGSDEGTLINGSRMPPGEEWALHKGD